MRVAAPALLHSSFYRFTPVADPAALAARLRSEAGLLMGRLLGSVVVAAEGISGAVAGPAPDVAAFEAALQQADLLDGALQGMAFKHSGGVTAPFGRLKVAVKPEIVALGGPQDGSLGHGATAHDDSGRLAPAAWQALLARGDAVVLDNRNHFEFRLGHFQGAIDPRVHNFRDFQAYVVAQAPAWRTAGRPVAMYCTGGVRCDKTAPWMRSLGLDVWQLDGGILGYLQAVGPADTLWQGECFVFDNRIALDARLQETPTRAEDVYDPRHPDEAWRLQRAARLDSAGD